MFGARLGKAFMVMPLGRVHEIASDVMKSFRTSNPAREAAQKWYFHLYKVSKAKLKYKPPPAYYRITATAEQVNLDVFGWVCHKDITSNNNNLNSNNSGTRMLKQTELDKTKLAQPKYIFDDVDQGIIWRNHGIHYLHCIPSRGAANPRTVLFFEMTVINEFFSMINALIDQTCGSKVLLMYRQTNYVCDSKITGEWAKNVRAAAKQPGKCYEWYRSRLEEQCGNPEGFKRNIFCPLLQSSLSIALGILKSQKAPPTKDCKEGFACVLASRMYYACHELTMSSKGSVSLNSREQAAVDYVNSCITGGNLHLDLNHPAWRWHDPLLPSYPVVIKEDQRDHVLEGPAYLPPCPEKLFNATNVHGILPVEMFRAGELTESWCKNPFKEQAADGRHYFGFDFLTARVAQNLFQLLRSMNAN